jgi:outer membrane protein
MKRLPLLLLAIFASPLARAADLVEIYRDAQSQDAAFASAQAAYRAAQEKLPQGRALLLPTVNLGANTTYNDVDTTYRSPSAGLTSGSRSYNSSGYTLSLNQPLYRKQNFAQYQESKSFVAQAEAQFAIARQDLVLRVAQAYFDVLLAQDNVALSGAQKSAISEQLAQAKRNFEVGTATITDTHEAQARFDLTTAQEIAAQNDLEVKRSVLQRIVSKPPEKLSPLGEKLPLKLPEPNDMEQWVANAEQQNLQLRVQRAALDIAAQEVERNRGGRYPTLDLVASYSDNSAGGGSFGGVDSNSTAIGLQLNLPVYAGGALTSRVREAMANQEKARQDAEDARRQVDLQTRQSFLGVKSGAAQVKALEQALVSNQSSLDSTRLGLEVGVRTGVDVLNAQQQLYSARRDLAQARYNYILSQLRLRAAVGTLGEPDLAQVNEWLARK